MAYKHILNIEVTKLDHNLSMEDVKRILSKKYDIGISIDNNWLVIKYNREGYDMFKFVNSLKKMGNFTIHFEEVKRKRPIELHSEEKIVRPGALQSVLVTY